MKVYVALRQEGRVSYLRSPLRDDDVGRLKEAYHSFYPYNYFVSRAKTATAFDSKVVAKAALRDTFKRWPKPKGARVVFLSENEIDVQRMIEAMVDEVGGCHT